MLIVWAVDRVHLSKVLGEAKSVWGALNKLRIGSAIKRILKKLEIWIQRNFTTKKMHSPGIEMAPCSNTGWDLVVRDYKKWISSIGRTER